MKPTRQMLLPEAQYSPMVLPRITEIATGDEAVRTTVWDIPNTISELSYLTHGHYRYYGKFPSAVASQILESHPLRSRDSYVLDNFCGSGTTLVECKLRRMHSFGIDVSWIAALVSRVKTAHVDIKCLSRLCREAASLELSVPEQTPLEVERWFTPTTYSALRDIRQWILSQPLCRERDFLVVALLAIVRRVSRAYDGEVRPHVNGDKAQRAVLPAFLKKLREMLENQESFQLLTSDGINSYCFVGNNTDLPKCLPAGCELVVSHPPYLNSFNYRPVFQLEFFLGAPFEKDYAEQSKIGLAKRELTAHPATDKNIESYFDHLSQCYAETARLQDSGNKLAIVIGDCTRQGRLIPVINRTVSLVSSVGYRLLERNFRTTHYGLGKYAYSHRADYHSEAEQKRDAILIFSRL